MPSDSNGVYSLPDGYLAVTGTTIQASQHNPPLEDIAAGLTARLMRSGAAPMTGVLKLIDGLVGGPALTFNSAQTTGFYKTANGVGLAINGTLLAEWKATGLEIGGRADFVTEAQLADKAVTLRKLYKPSGPAKILGTNSNAALTITGAANNGAGLIRLSVASTTTFATGQKKTVLDVQGTVEANGTWTITVVDGTHIDLQGSTFTNAWTSGGTIGGGVDELSLGTGLKLNGSILTAPASPPTGASSRKVIKVTGNTGCSVTAASVVVSDGAGNFANVALNSTVNLATNGGIDAMEGALTLAGAAWLSLWAIAKADGSAPKVLANYSDTAIAAMPTDYTLKALIGHLRVTASNLLMGSWQFGNRFQYKLGLAQTTKTVVVAEGVQGGYSATAPTWTTPSVAGIVPPTAQEICLIISNTYKGGGNSGLQLAPTTAYKGYQDPNGLVPFFDTNPTPVLVGTIALQPMVLEGDTVAWVSSQSGGVLLCSGYIENL